MGGVHTDFRSFFSVPSNESVQLILPERGGIGFRHEWNLIEILQNFNKLC